MTAPNTFDRSTPQTWADSWIEQALRTIPTYAMKHTMNDWIADSYSGDMPWSRQYDEVASLIEADPRWEELKRLFRFSFGSDLPPFTRWNDVKY